ncbi:DUF4260 domain-containing protein [Deinococcus sp. Leaf326]|uniref:DUF4260 domain-containing protein n=1 Tax=Deinococcus sp. Leaf326 TaxID=1736338 RepID=UPI00070061C7|nr:DUF4260 domain-containing protein [Deinococcus sp. Leaf326]KQR33009.1 hypothetical protein ASF71_17195 [Deinococcus sp. Leaf326]
MRQDSTTTLLRLEAAGVFALTLTAYLMTGGPSWLWFLVLLPDLSFLAYLAGSRTGAAGYNFAHSYLTPMLLGLVGVLTHHPFLLSAALIWAAHIAADRVLGYGLKRTSGFGDTHLSQKQSGKTMKVQSLQGVQA